MTPSVDQAYGEAAAEVVGERAEAMFGKRRGVLDTADIASARSPTTSAAASP